MTPSLFAPPESAVRISSARASNGKWAIVQTASGYNSLFTVAGEFVRLLPAVMGHSSQIVFSWTEQNIAYFVPVGGNRLCGANLSVGDYWTVKEFPEYASLASHTAEGDLTEDGHLALCGVRPDGIEEAFLFHIDGNTKGPVYPQTEPFDGIKAAVGGYLLLSGPSGIRCYPPVGESYMLTTANGHACADVHNGRPVLLWCNSDDDLSVSDEELINTEVWLNAVVMIDIETGKKAALKSFPWAYAMHISTGGIVSVYDPPDSGVSKGLPNQIWQLALDGSQNHVLLHEWRAPYRKDFEPRATISADGSLILYNVPTSDSCNVWGLRMEKQPVVVPVDPPGLVLVSMENEADADYVMELPVRGGKALPWKMFKRLV